MRLVAENRSDVGNPSARLVRLYTGGIREVVHGDSKAWSRYIIIPRRLILNEIRRLRAKGCQVIGSWNFWELLPDGAAAMIRPERYGNPGSSFVREPFKYKTRNRKFVIIYQCGGLDI